MRILLAWLLLSCGPLWAQVLDAPNTFSLDTLSKWKSARQVEGNTPRRGDPKRPAELPFCRIYNGRNMPIGSGTLIDRTQTQGFVITCNHVVRTDASPNGPMERGVWVRFMDGKRYPARIVKVNPVADLAALVIARPDQWYLVSGHFSAVDQYAIAGFGTSGQFRQVVGKVITTGSLDGVPSYDLNVSIRPGDSGAGVYEVATGKFVGVAWGSDAATNATAAFTAGETVRKFVAQCFGPNCYNPSPAMRRVVIGGPPVRIPNPAGPGTPPLTIPTQPELQPERPVVIPDIDPDLDKIREEMAKLREELLASIQPGPAGPQGPPGEQGPPGLDADPTVLIQFNSRISALEAELADKDTLAGQLAPRLPVSLQQVDKDGRPVGPLQKRNLTEPLNIGAYLVERE